MRFPQIGTLRQPDGTLDPFCAIGPGWHQLVLDLDATLTETEKDNPEACYTQIKEKFGGLRVYTGGMTQAGRAAIREAEEKAYRTCEVCGKAGVLRRGSWVMTLCDEHSGGRPPFPPADDEEDDE